MSGPACPCARQIELRGRLCTDKALGAVRPLLSKRPARASETGSPPMDNPARHGIYASAAPLDPHRAISWRGRGSHVHGAIGSEGSCNSIHRQSQHSRSASIGRSGFGGPWRQIARDVVQPPLRRRSKRLRLRGVSNPSPRPGHTETHLVGVGRVEFSPTAASSLLRCSATQILTAQSIDARCTSGRARPMSASTAVTK